MDQVGRTAQVAKAKAQVAKAKVAQGYSMGKPHIKRAYGHYAIAQRYTGPLCSLKSVGLLPVKPLPK
ncbi:hypothetical protein KIPB_010247 [Kipferlia bialata]|uniref:Uncharacterized protein n=1 Tax=Kipferlia bialata TaxID=797122 RepID=A0A9K3GM81_9EUKA|nr:hypothetical protein KIPB_010247 [Kipferlia bialata]|eukprot:g10247.t1